MAKKRTKKAKINLRVDQPYPNNEPLLWANPDYHDDLIEMFKKAFPKGIHILTAGYHPSLRIDYSFRMTEIGVRLLLMSYCKDHSA